MKWDKKGVIYVPNARHFWNQSHAQVPVADSVGVGVWRIYFATRDSANHSYTSYIEVEAGRPNRLQFECDRPLLPLGKLGAFDEDGTMPSCILTVGAEKYLYYIGWSQKKSVPYQNSIGLAISGDGGRTFAKYSEGPLLGVDSVDPYFTGTIFVFSDAGLYRAYYLSCVEWRVVAGKPEPLYVLKYAESDDGIRWKREGHVAIPFKNSDEGGLVSAAVTKRNGKYCMWFSCRKYFDFRENANASYRIGYAESADGVNWLRDDERSGIGLSPTGWDSEMIAYPYLLEHGEDLYMFYNGNGFGKAGFGYAVLNATT